MDDSSHESRLQIQPVPVYFASSPQRGDVISLLGLWRVVFSHKVAVLSCLVSCLIIATVYLYMVTPEYKATAYLLPPKQQDIQGLLIDSVNPEYGDIVGFDSNKITPKSVYENFLHNLKSQGLRREFFDDNNLVANYVEDGVDEDVSVDLVFNEAFSKKMQVRVDRVDPSVVAISFTHSDPEISAKWLNGYIDFANRRTVNQLYSDVNAAIQAEVSKIRQQMSTKLMMADQRRLDNIVSLNEALRIAKALGIEDTSTFPKVNDRGQPGLAVNTAQVPLYMRGTDALETEILVLETRKSNEPFAIGFRDLQERRAFLEEISIDKGLLSAVAIDAAARVPYQAESPRSVLIMLLAAVLGLVAGISVALAVDSNR